MSLRVPQGSGVGKKIRNLESKNWGKGHRPNVIDNPIMT
jgi:hypothetical protein